MAARVIRRKPLKLERLTVRRFGETDFEVVGDHHCGEKTHRTPGVKRVDNENPFSGAYSLERIDHMRVRWSIVVRCKPKLDGRGFLFDQAPLAAWMTELGAKATGDSCERLAARVGRELLAKLQREAKHCEIVGLKVTLSPRPHGASVTARFGEEVD